MKVYRIIDTKTGLFSGGGTYPRFTKRGKVWTTRGALKAHLNCCLYRQTYRWENGKHVKVESPIPETWKVVVYDLDASVIETMSASEEARRPAKR